MTGKDRRDEGKSMCDSYKNFIIILINNVKEKPNKNTKRKVLHKRGRGREWRTGVIDV